MIAMPLFLGPAHPIKKPRNVPAARASILVPAVLAFSADNVDPRDETVT